jgi:hypothetical protein
MKERKWKKRKKGKKERRKETFVAFIIQLEI